MKDFSVTHFSDRSIPPIQKNGYNNKDIDYCSVKIKFAEIISAYDVTEIYSISDELRIILSAITALNLNDNYTPSVMVRIEPRKSSPFIIEISTGDNGYYIIQTLDLGTFAPFGEKCTCPAINGRNLEHVKETIYKYCEKLTEQETILNKIAIASDYYQILYFPANRHKKKIF